MGVQFQPGERERPEDTQPSTQLVPGAPSVGLKLPVHEADHSPSSAMVKNAWSCATAPPCVFISWCLIKCKGNFTLLLRKF
jgi:hypothetical protein